MFTENKVEKIFEKAEDKQENKRRNGMHPKF